MLQVKTSWFSTWNSGLGSKLLSMCDRNHYKATESGARGIRTKCLYSFPIWRSKDIQGQAFWLAKGKILINKHESRPAPYLSLMTWGTDLGNKVPQPYEVVYWQALFMPPPVPTLPLCWSSRGQQTHFWFQCLVTES